MRVSLHVALLALAAVRSASGFARGAGIQPCRGRAAGRFVSVAGPWPGAALARDDGLPRRRDAARGLPATKEPLDRDPGPEGAQAEAFALDIGGLPEGLSVTPTIVSILTVYFVQGALGISSLATSLFLKDELHLGPAETTALTGIFALPWVIKPVYGFLTDTFPIFGLRRRPYLVGAGLLGASAQLSLCFLVDAPWQALVACTASNLGIAFSDVVADSLCVEAARSQIEDLRAEGTANATELAAREQDVAGALQSLCWGSRYVGGVAAAAASGKVLEVLTTRQVFAATAVFPLIAAVSGLLAAESAVVESGKEGTTVVDAVGRQAAELWDTVRQRRIWLPLAVVAFWLATPSSGSAFFYFLTNELKLGPAQLGRLQLLNSLASLGGVVLYRTLFAETKTSTLIGIASLASVPLGLLQLLLVTHQNQALGIPDGWLIYGDDVFLAALGELAFMPTLTLAARLCPPGQEGTLFALLMSAYNGSGVLGSEVGALITKALGVTSENFANLPMLIVLCNLTSLLPLPLLGFLDAADGEEEQQD